MRTETKETGHKSVRTDNVSDRFAAITKTDTWQSEGGTSKSECENRTAGNEMWEKGKEGASIGRTPFPLTNERTPSIWQTQIFRVEHVGCEAHAASSAT